MYAVVGCSECSMLWVVEGRPETSQCPRCGKRRQYAKRKKFVSTEDRDHAKEVRASMLANRQDQGDTFAEMDSFADMETQLDDVGVPDEEYLEASGIDAEEVAAAGERASTSGGASPSRKEVVENALGELERPTGDEIVEYAAEHGVSEGYVQKALEKLVRRGEVSESRGQYRRL
jgi:hypothetical protein